MVLLKTTGKKTLKKYFELFKIKQKCWALHYNKNKIYYILKILIFTLLILSTLFKI